MEEKKICVYPGCSRKAARRGLCSNCYQSARYVVGLGEATWEQLEADGKTLPRKGNKRAWFSDAKPKIKT